MSIVQLDKITDLFNQLTTINKAMADIQEFAEYVCKGGQPYLYMEVDLKDQPNKKDLPPSFTDSYPFSFMASPDRMPTVYGQQMNEILRGMVPQDQPNKKERADKISGTVTQKTALMMVEYIHRDLKDKQLIVIKQLQNLGIKCESN